MTGAAKRRKCPAEGVYPWNNVLYNVPCLLGSTVLEPLCGRRSGKAPASSKRSAMQ